MRKCSPEIVPKGVFPLGLPEGLKQSFPHLGKRVRSFRQGVFQKKRDSYSENRTPVFFEQMNLVWWKFELKIFVEHLHKGVHLFCREPSLGHRPDQRLVEKE